MHHLLLAIGIFTAWACASVGFAQTEVATPAPEVSLPKEKVHEKGLLVGVRVAPALTMLLNKDLKSTDDLRLSRGPGFGWSAGVAVGEYFSANWGFEVGAEYAFYTQELEYTLKATDSSYTTRQDVTYLQFPMLARLSTSAAKPLRFTGILGLQIAVLRSAEQFLNNEKVVPDPDDPTLTVRDRYAAAQFGAIAGGGISYAISDRLLLDALLLANLSIVDIEDRKLKVGTDQGAARWLAAGLRLGLSYRLPFEPKPRETAPVELN
jgi:hypothetical protein